MPATALIDEMSSAFQRYRLCRLGPGFESSSHVGGGSGLMTRPTEMHTEHLLWVVAITPEMNKSNGFPYER